MWRNVEDIYPHDSVESVCVCLGVLVCIGKCVLKCSRVCVCVCMHLFVCLFCLFMFELTGALNQVQFRRKYISHAAT